MKKKKILVVSIGIWPPAVKMAGTAAIYHLLKLLAKEDSFEIHILTALPSWADPDVEQWAEQQKREHNLTLHFVKADNLFLTRFLFFLEALKLQRQFKFDLLHDYSSSPLLVGLTGVLGKIWGCKTVHTLCSANEGFWGSKKFGFGRRWVTAVIDKTPFGVDTEKFKPRSRNFQKKILFLGQLDERKGAPVLMRAAKKVIEKYPDAKFIFASYGKEGRDPNYHANKKVLQEMSLGLEKNVRFLEGTQDVPQLMADADIFILPATSLHGTLTPPLTLIEAMSVGKACIVSDVCRNDGLVEDEINCLLFQSGNVDDLSDKINLLLGDEALRESLGRSARQKVVERFDVNETIKELSKVYLIKFDNSQN